MRPSYKRDMEHNYMILESPINVQGSEYQIRMLLQNHIPGLLACNMRTLDGTQSFYYEITSRQPLSRIFQISRMNQRDIYGILTGIKRGMEGIKRYLLNPDHLLLNPDYIYMDPETQEVWLCCLPFYEGQVTESFRELAEFILKHLDHDDSEAVVWGYEIYSEAAKENYSLESILKKVYRQNLTVHSQRRIPEQPIQEEIQKERPQLEQEQSIQTEDKKEKKCGLRSCFLPAIGGLFIAAEAVICWVTGLNLTQSGGILFLSVGIGVYVFECSRKKSEKKKWSQRRIQKNKGTVYQECFADDKEQENHQNTGNQIEEQYRTTMNNNNLIEKETEEEISNKKTGESFIQEVFGETRVLSSGSTSGGARLISVHPQVKENTVLTDDIFIIGKLKGHTNMMIPLPEISRIHACIEKRQDGYYLKDLNSRNGTFLNGIRLEMDQTVKLKNEDSVHFASVKFFFQE